MYEKPELIRINRGWIGRRPKFGNCFEAGLPTPLPVSAGPAFLLCVAVRARFAGPPRPGRFGSMIVSPARPARLRWRCGVRV